MKPIYHLAPCLAVAKECGFDELAKFRYQLKQVLGISPSESIKRQRVQLVVVLFNKGLEMARVLQKSSICIHRS